MRELALSLDGSGFRDVGICPDCGLAVPWRVNPEPREWPADGWHACIGRLET